VCALQHAWLSRKLKPSRREDFLEELLGAVFQERHAPSLDELDLGFVDVVDADLVAAVGERQCKRKADMTATADDDEV
jgi:hypothetical protein